MIGSEHRSIEQLKNAGVSYVLNLALSDAKDHYQDSGIEYYHFPIEVVNADLLKIMAGFLKD